MSSKLIDYDKASEVEGTLKFDGDWVLLEVPQSVHNVLLAQVSHLDIKPNKNPHISVMKDELPSLNLADWHAKKFDGETVKFKISENISHENGLHVWIDCYSPRLCEIREYFGLPTLKQDGVYRVNFHCTLGKLKKFLPKNLRKQYRLSKRTHIDCETLMQHI